MAFTTKHIQKRRIHETGLPFKQVNVHNMFQFHPEGIQDTEEESDLVKALPQSAENTEDGQFDIVIVIVGNEAESTGLAGQ